MPQTMTPMQESRLRRGWTLRELAQQCAKKGVQTDSSNLSKIERGKYTPRPRLRAALAEVLDLNVRDLEAS